MASIHLGKQLISSANTKEEVILLAVAVALPPGHHFVLQGSPRFAARTQLID